MKNGILTAVILLTGICAFNGFTEKRAAHYRPEGRSAVTVNGPARFNRALYGAHSGFRLECSDTPEFGIYLPRMGGNMLFTLPRGDCEARYAPGKMIYTQGGVGLEAQVMRGYDLALWSLSNRSKHPVNIPVRFGGVADKKFHREGDLGVDDPTCFDLKPEYCTGNEYRVSGDTVRVDYGTRERKTLTLLIPGEGTVTDAPFWSGSIRLAPGETKYVLLSPTGTLPAESPEKLMARAERERSDLTGTVEFSAPDAWLNPIGGALAVAADGIWGGQAWLHGAVGWRTPHLGWRGAYAGAALGLTDRAMTHFRTYAANQITDCPPVLQQPRQDSALNLARAEKRWATPFYSDGYICRRPGKKDEMSHYDMNIVYADALLRYLRQTGDTAAMREFHPVLQRHLDWENRNFDPDGNGLYDAYCCIWASDALFYGGGDVTHSSAYNCFANRLMADASEAIGMDPEPYRSRAAAIAHAIDSALWMPDRGYWAEYRDYGKGGRLHPSSAIWTIYLAIDSEISTPFRNYAATCYVDSMIPHIPVEGDGVGEGLAVISTSRWKPYSWSINNVAVAENMHMALAYWLAGRPEEACRLARSVAADNMYHGGSPLNFGQISHYDAARGECYRDFADPVGVWSRAMVEGLYGIRPKLLGQEPRVEITPGFPDDWDSASVKLPYLSYDFRRDGTRDIYTIVNHCGTPVRLTAPSRGVRHVLVNGKSADWRSADCSMGMPRVEIDAPSDTLVTVTIERPKRFSRKPSGALREEGPVRFREYKGGGLSWWEAEVGEYPLPSAVPDVGLRDVNSERCRPVDIATAYNARITDIYRNEYLSPRPPVTTLQIPKQGIGEWCHPLATADIDDAPLRDMLRANGGILTTESGVPFRMPSEGQNIAYASRWDNYPDSVTVKLDGSRAAHIYLLVAGSAGHMQCEMENARISVRYTDGTRTGHPLVSPYNYAPIEREYFYDDHAFALAPAVQAPPRVHFAPGKTKDTDVPKNPLAGKKGAEGGVIPGGAGVMVDIPVDPTRRLEALTLTVLSPDIVTGIAAVTLQ